MEILEDGYKVQMILPQESIRNIGRVPSPFHYEEKARGKMTFHGHLTTTELQYPLTNERSL